MSADPILQVPARKAGWAVEWTHGTRRRGRGRNPALADAVDLGAEAEREEVAELE
jgi:hypothetical protein